jgi:hypothetical protein
MRCRLPPGRLLLATLSISRVFLIPLGEGEGGGSKFAFFETFPGLDPPPLQAVSNLRPRLRIAFSVSDLSPRLEAVLDGSVFFETVWRF